MCGTALALAGAAWGMYVQREHWQRYNGQYPLGKCTARRASWVHHGAGCINAHSLTGSGAVSELQACRASSHTSLRNSELTNPRPASTAHLDRHLQISTPAAAAPCWT